MKLIEINASRNDVGDTQVAFYFVHEGRTFAVAQRFSRNEHSYDVAQKLHLLEERIANVTSLVTGAGDDVGTLNNS